MGAPENRYKTLTFPGRFLLCIHTDIYSLSRFSGHLRYPDMVFPLTVLPHLCHSHLHVVYSCARVLESERSRFEH